MSFKDIVNSDISRVFLNDSEFAEVRDIIIAGVTYSSVACVLENQSQDRINKASEGRRVSGNNQVDGLKMSVLILYVKLSDIGGTLPREMERLSLVDSSGTEKYYISESALDLGVCKLKLEEFID